MTEQRRQLALGKLQQAPFGCCRGTAPPHRHDRCENRERDSGAAALIGQWVVLAEPSAIRLAPPAFQFYDVDKRPSRAHRRARPACTAHGPAPRHEKHCCPSNLPHQQHSQPAAAQSIQVTVAQRERVVHTHTGHPVCRCTISLSQHSVAGQFVKFTIEPCLIQGVPISVTS